MFASVDTSIKWTKLQYSGKETLNNSFFRNGDRHTKEVKGVKDERMIDRKDSL